MKISKLLILFFTISLGSLSIALDEFLKTIPPSEIKKNVDAIFSSLDIEKPIQLHNTAKLYLHYDVKLVKDVSYFYRMQFPGLKDDDILIFAALAFIDESGRERISDFYFLPLKSITDEKGSFKQRGSFTMYVRVGDPIFSFYSDSFKRLSKDVAKKAHGGFDSPNEKTFRFIFQMPSIPVKIDYSSNQFISFSIGNEAIRKIENLKQKQEKIRSRL